jgi:hypothetical protein
MAGAIYRGSTKHPGVEVHIDQWIALVATADASALARSLIMELARADIPLFVVLYKTMLGHTKAHGPPEIEGLPCVSLSTPTPEMSSSTNSGLARAS